MTESKPHPELHVNEEPTNDFVDFLVSATYTFGFFLLIAAIATIISLYK